MLVDALSCFAVALRACPRVPSQVASLQGKTSLSFSMSDQTLQRKHLRQQFLTGRTRREVPFEDDKWYLEHDVELLDLHYQCDSKQALNDAFYMICSETPRITIKERKKKTTKDGDEEPPKKRTKLDPCEPEIISDWYENKNRELESGPDGEQYKKEREEREHRVQQQVEAQQQVATT